MRIMTAYAAFFVFALLIGCAPTAQTNQSTEPGNGIPIAGSSPQQSDGPVEPTATPVPEPPKPPAADPTATPKAPPPTRSQHLSDENPDLAPTPDHGGPAPTPASPIVDGPAEPEDGISLCYRINLFNTTIEEQEYLDWCHGALVEDVVDNCSGTGDSAAELSCAQGRLANVQMYLLRELLVPCSAVSDEDDRLACGQRVNAAASEHRRIFWATWSEILRTVDSHADVKVRKAAMADCVAGKGFARPDPNAPIRWQERKAPDERKTLRGDPEAVRVATIARLAAIDECAAKVELYVTQELVWLTEILRVQEENPAKVKPLIDDGIVEALRADGIASFLTPGR